MTIDYAKSITFAFDDKEWLSKLGRAAMWAFISVLLFIFPVYFFGMGYGLETARNVMSGKKNPLPDLEDVGAIYMDGLKFFVVVLVYALPSILLVCLMYAGLIGAAIAGEQVDSDSLEVAAGGMGMVVQCLNGIYSLVLALLWPAIMTIYLRTGDIRESLNVSKVFAIVREHFVVCLMIALMQIAAGMLFSVVFMLSFITICGWIFIYFAGIPWLSAVNGHLSGQFASQLDNKSQDFDMGYMN